ncbi:MAG: hypothetical protein Q8T09_02875 [Candidatus Melainabacteria bacterium]|nr:hypothetical protein [Candidatus Melainabacteria bacterium]
MINKQKKETPVQPIMVVCTMTVVKPDGTSETKKGPFLRIVE